MKLGGQSSPSTGGGPGLRTVVWEIEAPKRRLGVRAQGLGTKRNIIIYCYVTVQTKALASESAFRGVASHVTFSQSSQTPPPQLMPQWLFNPTNASSRDPATIREGYVYGVIASHLIQIRYLLGWGHPMSDGSVPEVPADLTISYPPGLHGPCMRPRAAALYGVVVRKGKRSPLSHRRLTTVVQPCTQTRCADHPRTA